MGNGADEGVVRFRSLSCDAEVLRGEAAEVGGIANEDTMLGGKVFLECCGGVVSKTAKHEVGLRGSHADTRKL